MNGPPGGRERDVLRGGNSSLTVAAQLVTAR